MTGYSKCNKWYLVPVFYVRHCHWYIPITLDKGLREVLRYRDVVDGIGVGSHAVGVVRLGVVQRDDVGDQPDDVANEEEDAQDLNPASQVEAAAAEEDPAAQIL